MHTRNILNLSAGQTTFTALCSRTLGEEVVPIYYPPYWELESQVREWLREMLGTKNEIIIMTGTGTYGLEASLNSFLSRGEKFLVINTGIFGDVLATLTRRVGAIPIELRAPPGKTVDLEKVEEALKTNRDVKGVGVVHTETSTGVRNPVREIAAIAKSYGEFIVLVDAISSFGSEELEVDNWGIDICVTSSQKCLGAPQGTTIVSVSSRAWDVIEKRKDNIHGICLNLHVWREYNQMVTVDIENWAKGYHAKPSPLTDIIHGPSPSYALIRGLWASLKEIREEGFVQFRRRHEVAAKAVREGVKALGLRVLADESCADNSVTAVLIPEKVDELSLRRRLFEVYGVAFANGYKELGINYIRFGTMGESARFPKVLQGVMALGRALQDFGVSTNIEAGIDAVVRVYQKEGMV